VFINASTVESRGLETRATFDLLRAVKGATLKVVSYTSFRRARNGRRSLVQSDDSHRRPVCYSTARVLSPGSRYAEETTLLRSKIDQLNNDTFILIAQAEKLIQESERLSARVKALENANTEPKYS